MAENVVALALHHDEGAVSHWTEDAARAFLGRLQAGIERASAESEFKFEIETTKGRRAFAWTLNEARDIADRIEAALSLRAARRLGQPVGKVDHVTRDASKEITAIHTRYQY